MKGESRAGCPARVVALGGGTGLPVVLRGLRDLVTSGDVSSLTAVVAMSDDGGSSGRLRRNRGMLPPGDVRNCLLSLSEEQDLLAALFNHRYEGGAELGGHNLGNLILAALAEQTGSFLKAVEVSSRVLRTVGRILPVTLENVELHALLEDGSELRGESAIGTCGKQIREIALEPRSASPTAGVAESILDAEMVVIGPGSLFTSLLPCLVLDDVARALRRTNAVRVLVANLVSDPREAPGLELPDQLDKIESHAAGKVVDAVLIHEGPVPADVVERYRAEGAEPLKVSDGELPALQVIRRPLIADCEKLRHDPHSLATGLLACWDESTARSDVGELRSVRGGQP